MAGAAKVDNGIIMVLSPAKTMDLRPLSERDLADGDAVSRLHAEHRDAAPCDAVKTDLIAAEMRGKTEAQLKSLLGLSPSLAKTARSFWTDFSPSGAGRRLPAMLTFSGPAFQGLDPSTCDAGTLSYLASNLFVLDPVYGVLRSLQGMQPYRLEMGCKLFEPEGGRKRQSLAQYWRDSVTRYLGAELDGDVEAGTKTPATLPGILANLASEEYSASIHPPSLPPDTIYLNVVFRHKGRVLAVHAKRARGLMARYLAERGATTLEEASEFDREGYGCVEVSEGDGGTERWETLDTVGENVRIVRMVFDREDAPPKETVEKKRAAAGLKRGGGRRSAGKKTKN